jgi:hypothetical protein
MKSIVCQLRAESGKFETRSQKNLRIFNACNKIYETDISSLYENLHLDISPIYYVYAHSDPSAMISAGRYGRSTFAATIGLTKLPFYISKGVGDRAYDLNRNETHRKFRQTLHKFNKEIEVSIFKSELTEVDALMIESKLIDIFGIIATGGNLVNLDEGINNKERQMLYKDALSELNDVFKNSV